jgi:hypothetical protein
MATESYAPYHAECPDCMEKIPEYACVGDECLNCGHIFTVGDLDE